MILAYFPLNLYYLERSLSISPFGLRPLTLHGFFMLLQRPVAFQFLEFVLMGL
jgi:hypothetical protein